MMRLAVVDDEKEILNQLTQQIYQKQQEWNIPCKIDAFLDSETFLHSPIDYDAVFLDININGTNGMDTAKLLRHKKKTFPIIFITILSEYVFSAFEVQAFDYLIKPIDINRFHQVIHRLNRYLSMQKKGFLLKNQGDCQIIKLEEILYCEVYGRKLYVHTKDNKFVCYQKIEQAQEELSGQFYRCHRSYLVNLEYIKAVEGGFVLLANKEKIPVSRMRRQKLLEAILEYMKGNSNLL